MSSPLRTHLSMFDHLVRRDHLRFELPSRDADNPPDSLRLGELRARMRHPSFTARRRDQLVDAAAIRARDDGEEWVVVLVAMLASRLVPLADYYRRRCPLIGDDIEAVMLDELRRVVPDYTSRPHGATGWLLKKVRRKARQRLDRELAVLDCQVEEEAAEAAHLRREAMTSASPQRPWGHPDLVLDEAVQAGVVSASEADLIGVTRLEGCSLRHVAQQRGIALSTLGDARRRAETKLVGWIRSGKSMDLTAMPDKQRSRRGFM